ncbi:hypothetical protein BDV18DRAFT_142464, partial [Aspergillus unguis]
MADLLPKRTPGSFRLRTRREPSIERSHSSFQSLLRTPRIVECCKFTLRNTQACVNSISKDSSLVRDSRIAATRSLTQIGLSSYSCKRACTIPHVPAVAH